MYGIIYMDDYISNLKIELNKCLHFAVSDLNPIGIQYLVFHPDTNNHPLVTRLELSKDGTFQDYISDIYHDSKGPRTGDTWKPFENLQNYISREQYAKLVPHTETIAINLAVDGIIEQSSNNLVYWQLAKYQLNQRAEILNSLAKGRSMAVTTAAVRNSGFFNNPSISDADDVYTALIALDSDDPDGFQKDIKQINATLDNSIQASATTLDHGVSTTAVMLGTGMGAHNLITLGHLYDTGFPLKRGSEFQPYPFDPNMFQRIGCAVCVSHANLQFILYIHGYADDNVRTFAGSIFYAGNQYDFTGGQELSANIPDIGLNKYYKNGAILGLPQCLSAIIKYLGDRAHIPVVIYSCWIDKSGPKLVCGTHDSIAFSAMCNIKRYNDNHKFEGYLPIPCIFSRSNIKYSPQIVETNPHLQVDSISMRDSSFTPSGLFIYSIPIILDKKQIEQQAAANIRHNLIESTNNYIYLLDGISDKLANFLTNLKALIYTRQNRSFNDKIDDLILTLKYVIDKNVFGNRGLSDILSYTVSYLEAYKVSQTVATQQNLQDGISLIEHIINTTIPTEKNELTLKLNKELHLHRGGFFDKKSKKNQTMQNKRRKPKTHKNKLKLRNKSKTYKNKANQRHKSKTHTNKK